MRFFTVALLLATIALTDVQALAGEDLDGAKNHKETGIIFPIVLDDTRISGAGAEWLRKHSKNARFVLMGETHGVAGIANFAAALYHLSERSALAIETDPWAAILLEEIARSGERAFLDYYDRLSNQYGIPFYNQQEEARFLLEVTAQAETLTPVLWGVDQLFVMGGRRVIEVLEPRLKRKEAKEALAVFASQLAQRPALLGYAKQEALSVLLSALMKEKDGGVKEIAEAIRLTNQIYGPFTRGEGAVLLANKEREDYMKQVFFSHFSRASRGRIPPKVMLKFGSNHMHRGVSPTGVAALGGFVESLAIARGEETLSVAVLCGQGSKARQFDGIVQACLDSEYEDYRPFLEEIAKESILDGDILIDTLALRLSAHIGKVWPAAFRERLSAFDAIVLLADEEPATAYPAAIKDIDLADALRREAAR